MTVANTSIETYHNEIKGKKESGQNDIILSVVKRLGVACTANTIMKHTHMFTEDRKDLPINVVSRSLHNLSEKLKVLDYFDAKCKETERKAHHYFLRQEGKQINLF